MAKYAATSTACRIAALVSVFFLAHLDQFAVAADAGRGFLESSAHRRHRLTSDEDFRLAMETVMGCGAEGALAAERMPTVRQVLTPIWTALPKNEHGRVEWKMLRYAAHRYFLQQSSLLVRGFEPAKQVNSSHAGSAAIMSKHAPSLVESVLEGKRSSNGFTFDDAAALISTLEQLIFDAEGALLEEVYSERGRTTKNYVSHQDLVDILEAYVVHWMLGDAKDTVRILLNNRTLLETAFPHWSEISKFTQGMIKSMEYTAARQQATGEGRFAISREYTFADAHRAVGSITKTFAFYWESECQTIKNALVSLDKTGTGRVSLSEFYGANVDGEWRFGESEAYLRELGALDESNPQRGKQVILPNYMLGASNCIVTTEHYLVCCVNECETTLNELEAAIGAPLAEPDAIVALIGNMTTYDDDAVRLTPELLTQLGRIAETHNGKVPLHGRLFAQWLHYVFPQECPFPHKTGTYTSSTPTQFGDGYLVSEEDAGRHAAERRVLGENETSSVGEIAEEAQWMSQWSEEEELMVDYTSVGLRAPWDATRSRSLGLVGLAASVVAAMLYAAAKPSADSRANAKADAVLFGGNQNKMHYV
eukprot:TRINITY_DN121324_c0_g1_i1.p1 TRINITY_DN121324_c0_g1~~TRINITY_DN121324_c0_g1_i1.p1  ORF type:complete len:593 (-),score=155.33 TRINITY_DN121324_c0_g1_i1:142-1920(-)